MSEPETLVIPGLIDPHVHLREPGGIYKEGFVSGTKAAVAGGFVAIMDMPNNPSDDPENPYKNRTVSHYNLVTKIALATRTIFTDVGFYAEYKPELENVAQLGFMQRLSRGVKFYLEPTTGNETEYEPADFEPGAKKWQEVAHRTQPIIAHAEDRVIEEVIARYAGGQGNEMIQHPLHIPHIANRFVLDAVIAAKAKGWPVTGGVCPQQLFLSEEDIRNLGWFARMKPELGSEDDRNYLLAHIDSIDVIETDHAPHTKEEKERANRENPQADPSHPIKCYGVPGLEAVLPLFMQAFKEGKLTIDQLVNMTSQRPAEIFGLQIDPTSQVTVSMEQYEFEPKPQYSKAVYPYMGRVVTGKVVETRLHGVPVVQNGRILDQEPLGQILTPQLAA